jgi:hypothetical protein
MRVDTMMACHARARFARCFSLLATKKIVADGGGPPQDGAFYEVAGAGIVRFENVSQEHVLIYMYIHKHHARIMNTYGRRRCFRLAGQLIACDLQARQISKRG